MGPKRYVIASLILPISYMNITVLECLLLADINTPPFSMIQLNDFPVLEMVICIQ